MRRGRRSRLRAALAAGLALAVTVPVLDLASRAQDAGASGAGGPTLYLVGNLGGYVKECGCDRALQGGLVRVAAYLASARPEPEGAHALVDAGAFLRDDEDLARMRSQTALEAMGELPYAAVGLTPADLAFGSGLLRAGPTLPWVSSNLEQPPDLAAGWRAIRVGKLKLGVISVAALGTTSDARWGEALPAAQQAAEEARQDGASPLVLLADLTAEEAAELARQIGEVTLVVLARADRTVTPLDLNGVKVVGCGQHAEYLGRAELDPATGALVRLTWIPLDDRLDRAIPAGIGQIWEHYLEETEKLAQADEEERALLANEGLENPYVGWAVCKKCHYDAYGSWTESHHLRAWRHFDPLFADPPGTPQPTGPDGLPEGPPRPVLQRRSPQCVVCHVTGFRRLEGKPAEGGGPGPPRFVWFETGVSCEACHGPGGRHVALMEAGETAPDGGTGIDRCDLATARERVCARCHPADHSPRFDYRRYLGRKGMRHWDRKREQTIPPEVPEGPILRPH